MFSSEKNKQTKIIFMSYPNYSDNAYALFKYMLKNKSLEKQKYIWLISDKKFLRKLKSKENLKFIYKYSMIGILELLRANYIITTHGTLYKIKIFKKKKINLWHGMPLKNIELLDGKEKVHHQKSMIATSEIFQEKMCKCFGMSKEDVFLTGQPRNDLLFEETKFYEKMEINKQSYKKIIIYLPTYRSSIIGDIRNDGKYDKNKLGIIKINQLKKLNEKLIKNNNLMIIKLHPMDRLQQLDLEKFSNIIILKTEDLEKIDEQLYPLLGSTDLLITDYSSVWVDYEILGKPIYFAMDDYEEYKSNRGFTIENLPELLPGDIIQDFETLLKKLENIPDKIQKETGDMFNKYKDNKSCERVLKALGIL